MQDTCQVPALANWYYFVVFELQGETDYNWGYMCTDHFNDDPVFYAPEGAHVLEHEFTELR